MSESNKRLPYHEGVCEDIRTSPAHGLSFLGRQIMRTLIPKGHDEIILAWQARLNDMPYGSADLYVSVLNDLEEQKRISNIGRPKPGYEPDHGEGLGM